MKVKVLMTLCLIGTIGTSQAMMRNAVTKLASVRASAARTISSFQRIKTVAVQAYLAGNLSTKESRYGSFQTLHISQTMKNAFEKLPEIDQHETIDQQIINKVYTGQIRELQDIFTELIPEEQHQQYAHRIMQKLLDEPVPERSFYRDVQLPTKLSLSVLLNYCSEQQAVAYVADYLQTRGNLMRTEEHTYLLENFILPCAPSLLSFLKSRSLHTLEYFLMTLNSFLNSYQNSAGQVYKVKPFLDHEIPRTIVKLAFDQGNANIFFVWISYLPKKESEELSNSFLTVHFEKLDKNDIANYSEYLSHEQRSTWNALLLSKYGNDEISIETRFYCLGTLPEKEQEAVILKTLEYDFNQIKKEKLYYWIALLSQNNRILWSTIVLEKYIDQLNNEQIHNFVRLLPYPKQQAWAQKILESRQDTPDFPKELVFWIGYCTREQADAWIVPLLQKKDLKIEGPDLERLITLLSRSSLIALNPFLLEQYFDRLSHDFVWNNLIFSLPEEQKDQWKKKFLEKYDQEKQFEVVPEPSGEGPLFSAEFVSNHTLPLLAVLKHAPRYEMTPQSSINRFIWGNLPKQTKIEKFFSLFPNFSNDIRTLYKEGRIVLFHGQHSQWHFLELFFNHLDALKNGNPEVTNRIRLRFRQTSPLSPEDVQKTRNQGVTQATYCDYRPEILFTNLHLFANSYGSNSLLYFTENSDQTIVHGRFDFKNALKPLFTELGFEQEFERLAEQRSLFMGKSIFEELYDDYDDAIKESHNYGRLLVISMLPETAKRLCYPTRSGGVLAPLWINYKQTTDLEIISRLYNQVPWHNEYAFILGPEAYEYKNPDITITGYNPAITHRTPKYVKFETRFKEVMAHIEKLSKVRLAREALAQQNK